MDWSPKLVKRNGFRPDGAVRTVPCSGFGAVVHRGVHVVGVRGQVRQPRVVDANFGVGLGVPVGAGFGRHGAPEPGRRRAQHDARIADGLGGVP